MSLQSPFSLKRAGVLAAAITAFAVMAAGCASDAQPEVTTPQYGQLSEEELRVIQNINEQTQESLAEAQTDEGWTSDTTTSYDDVLRNTDIVYDEETASFINLEGAPASREVWQQNLERRQSELMDESQTPSPN